MLLVEFQRCLWNLRQAHWVTCCPRHFLSFEFEPNVEIWPLVVPNSDIQVSEVDDAFTLEAVTCGRCRQGDPQRSADAGDTFGGLEFQVMVLFLQTKTSL